MQSGYIDIDHKVAEMNPSNYLDFEIIDYFAGIEDAETFDTAMIYAKQKCQSFKGSSRNFEKLVKSRRGETPAFSPDDSIIAYPNCPIKCALKVFGYTADHRGICKIVARDGYTTESPAFPHPILPTEILHNIDTGNEKMRLAFAKNPVHWKSVVVPRNIVANKNKIIDLANKGIEVNSENATDLMKFITSVVNMNRNKIPTTYSASRLGWNGNDFIPYNNKIKFDGEEDFKHVFESVVEQGNFRLWQQETAKVRKNLVNRLVMAASFASPLIELLKVNIFTVLVWGKTGAGKTVSGMVAMSIWGNPKGGKLTTTVNNTENYTCRYAAMLRNIPVYADELQTVAEKGNFKSIERLIYNFCEGIERGRATVNDGVRLMRQWRNVLILSGEQPITSSITGAGARSRIIEIGSDDKLIENGRGTVDVIVNNFGHAGKMYIERVLEIKDAISEMYEDKYTKILNACDTNEKQASAMACMLVADDIARELFYPDEEEIPIDDIKDFLQSDKDIDIAGRAYEWSCGWVAQNYNRFTGDNTNGEIWGRLDNGNCVAVINKNVYEEYLREAGYDYVVILKEFAKRGWIIKTPQGKNVHNSRINGVKASSVKLILPSDEDIEL